MAGNSYERRIEVDDDEYFMAMAVEKSAQSEHPYIKVGACIVNQNKQIISDGCNNIPRECKNFPSRQGHPRLCHAEMNAITNSQYNVKNCTIYSTLFPCIECAELIIQSGIKTVVYMSGRNTDNYRTSREKLEAAGIEHRQYIARN